MEQIEYSRNFSNFNGKIETIIYPILHSNVKSRQFITQYPLLFHAPYCCFNLTFKIKSSLNFQCLVFLYFIWGGDFVLLLFQSPEGRDPKYEREKPPWVSSWESDFELFLFSCGRGNKMKICKKRYILVNIYFFNPENIKRSAV